MTPIGLGIFIILRTEKHFFKPNLVYPCGKELKDEKNKQWSYFNGFILSLI